MNEQDILNRWETEKQSYSDWGLFIAMQVEQHLHPRIAPVALNGFLKVPPSPRLKANNSLVDKALHRGKGYSDPYEEITDKVGLRYVVLLTSHIELLCEVIESTACEPLWSYSKDRNFEDERLARPLEFTYQSVHYVLRSKPGQAYEGRALPEGLACEVQVRSLLQHAYSELTHDTIYKPTVVAQPSVHRTVARSMALIETTDDCFVRAMQDLHAASEPQISLLAALTEAYRRGTGLQPGQELSNQLIIDALLPVLPAEPIAALDAFLAKKSYVFDRVKTRYANSTFFQQPAVLLAYWMSSDYPRQIKERWPINPELLAAVFSDLGVAFS
jgi:ppGpp synthetase/RelA/SpoT-type nucleotidyltranferase